MATEMAEDLVPSEGPKEPWSTVTSPPVSAQMDAALATPPVSCHLYPVLSPPWQPWKGFSMINQTPSLLSQTLLWLSIAF